MSCLKFPTVYLGARVQRVQKSPTSHGSRATLKGLIFAGIRFSGDLISRQKRKNYQKKPNISQKLREFKRKYSKYQCNPRNQIPAKIDPYKVECFRWGKVGRVLDDNSPHNVDFVPRVLNSPYLFGKFWRVLVQTFCRCFMNMALPSNLSMTSPSIAGEKVLKI